jgi:hypothetical protein
VVIVFIVKTFYHKSPSQTMPFLTSEFGLKLPLPVAIPKASVNVVTRKKIQEQRKTLEK